MEHVEQFWNMDLSIQKISDITKRTWSTVKAIVDSGFNLDKYKRITQAARKGQKLKFRPFKELKTSSPMKVQKIPVEAKEVSNSLSNMDDVLNHMWELQQGEAKELVKKAERDEAIHKIRNGLQKISEGLGALL